MTRAFLDIGQLKIKEATTFNPFSLPLFCLMTIYLFLGRIPFWLKHKLLVYLVLVAIFVVWILRLTA